MHIAKGQETRTQQKTAYERIKKGIKDVTYSDCLLAIKYDAQAIAAVPPDFITEELCLQAVKQNYKALNYVPDGFINLDMYRTLLAQISFSKDFKVWQMKEEYLDFNLADYEDYNKYEILRSSVAKINLHDMPMDILRIERSLSLRKTEDSFYDSESSLFTVCEVCFNKPEKHEFSNFQDFYTYLDGDLQGSDLTEYDFTNVDISAYNLDGAFLSSKVLVEKGDYNGEFYDQTIGKFKAEVSLVPLGNDETMGAGLTERVEICSEKLNVHERKVFYITDIHLNHQLLRKFPTCATFDEIRLFIEKLVKKMISTACERNPDDFLLVGGDVSFCFDVAKIFYKELCRYWNPKNIVAILGNHELWDFNRFAQKTTDNSVEHTIEKYRELFSSLRIWFLQNEVLVYDRFASSILSEEDILNKSIDDLRAVTSNSNLIIFGGIGFSAYNTEFNATIGIYRNAITSLQCELQYTQQSETVYNKLQDALSKNKLIVLSHMPPQDWSKRALVPNWIYVNGHTHRNQYVQSNECTIYADNQVGYKPRCIGLKYFRLSLYCDIFEDYIDGIYHITKTQYLDFNRHLGTICNFNRDVDCITMLKRQGLYLFLLENKENNKLFLLNGGTYKRLKIVDLEYYYENMLKYADYIKMGMSIMKL